MSYTEIGSISVGPEDSNVLVGPFLLGEDDDTLWVKVTQTNTANCPTWNYSFGLLTWVTSQGKELGTVKVYGNCDGEVYRLSTGLKPSERYGDLIFTPRSYNRRWISIDDPPLWTLAFEAQSGSISSAVPPVFGTRSTLGVLADIADIGVSYAIKGGFARVLLTP